MLGIKIQWNSFKWCPFCYSLNSDPKSWKIMDYRVRFLAKMWPTIKSTFRTSFERLFHTDHNGTIPSFIPHSHAKIWCVFHLTFWIHGVGISPNFWAMYYARYLGLGMRYEAGTCTIVISMNGAFRWCPFSGRLNFDPKSWKTMDYSLWSSVIFGKNVIDIKIHFQWPTIKITSRTSFESSFHADHNGTIPTFISHSHA